MDALRLIIISVPPKEVFLSLEKTILKLSKLTGSVTASTYPPHITLRTGVDVPLNNLVSFVSEFSILLAGIKSFRVRTDKLIKEKMVIDNKNSFFIGYEIILDNFLYDLNNNLLSYTKFRKSDRTEFHPHLSLAYKDLTVESFSFVCDWIDKHPDFSPPNLSWIMDNVSLYQFNGQQWVPFRVFPLGI